MKNHKGDRFTESSPLLPTRYAYEAAQLIRNLIDNFKVIVIVITFVLLVAIIDILHVIEPRSILLDEVLDATIAVVSIALLAVIVFLFRSLIKSRRVLTDWADLFERNSIKTGMTISMNKRTKEEAVRSIAETVQEIGGPLRNYISSRQDLNNFMDVHRGKGLIFDILIDKDVPELPSDLKNILTEYGAVVIKVIDGTIDKDIVVLFSNLLLEYTRETKNTVGLPVIIGENISNDAYTLVNASHEDVKRVVLVEKQSTEV